MASLQTALGVYLKALDQGIRSPELGPAAKSLGTQASRSTPAERDAVIDQLEKLLHYVEIERAGHATVVVGALVEQGANPGIALEVVLQRLTEILPEVRRFREACEAQEDEPDAPEDVEQSVANEHPEWVPAWNAFQSLPMGAIAMLSQSAEMRTLARKSISLLEDLESIDPHHFLALLLRVLDEEPVIVIHPGAKRAFRMMIGGISDNFQLHTLLADALIGPGRLGGSRPDPEVVSTAKGEGPQECPKQGTGVWDLLSWHAVRTDWTIETNLRMAPPEMVVWGEGTPSAIPPFEGIRTILLAPPSYGRSWTGSRTFAGMKAYARVTGEMSPAEVPRLLDRMAQAKRDFYSKGPK